MHRGQGRLDRAYEPVIELLRMGQVFPSGAFLKQTTELSDLVCHDLSPNRHSNTLQPIRQAEEQFHAIRQENGVDYYRPRRHTFKLCDPGACRVHTIVLKIVLQLYGLE